MALVGLSLLIASISFLCYRHPPSSWSSLPWLVRLVNRVLNNDAPATITNRDDGTDSNQEVRLEETQVTEEKKDQNAMPPPLVIAKLQEDRKAMPPPPPPFGKSIPSSARTPGATVPSFTHSDPAPAPASVPAPSFPAANSAQRASNGIRAPSTPTFVVDDYPSAPSFPAANSAQRASGGTNGPPRLNRLPFQSTSGGLMAPPSRSPLPNRGPSNSSSSLAPPPTHSAIPTKPRKKVLLSPGHSPLDWARVSSSPDSNLRGLPPSTPFLRVPPSLLRQMTGRKGKDAWTVLGGKVYNMTPYLPYHPGGEPELMKAAGRDGTKLFGEVHPWVNYEGMMEGCLIGIAVEEGDVRASSVLEEMD